MKLDSVKHILHGLGVPLTPSGVSGSWFNITCPFAQWYHKEGVDRNPSFGISFDETGEARSYYKCWSCGQKGGLSLLPAKLGVLRKKDYSELVQEAERMEYAEVGTPKAPEWDDTHAKKEEVTKKNHLGYFGSAMSHPYLRNRGYTWRDAWRLGLRYDVIQHRVLFPVFNNRLQLEGYTGRSTMPARFLTKGSGDNPKSRDYGGLDKRRLFLFNPRYYKKAKPSERLILVEGPFDYARGQQAGFVGTHGILGTALTEWKLNYLIELGRPVFLFMDNDEAGDAAMFGALNREEGYRQSVHLAWAYMLYQHVPVWICQYPQSAIDDERNDPDSLTVNEFRLAVEQAKIYTGNSEYFGRFSDDDIPF